MARERASERAPRAPQRGRLGAREHGVDVEQTNTAGETPLALALAAHMPFKSKHVIDRIVTTLSLIHI